METYDQNIKIKWLHLIRAPKMVSQVSVERDLAEYRTVAGSTGSYTDLSMKLGCQAN